MRLRVWTVNPWFCLSIYLSMNLSIFARSLCALLIPPFLVLGREGGGAWMEPAPEQREVEGRGWWCLLVRGAPLASYGLVAHFPSCSPVVVVVVVAHVFEQRLTRLALC